MNPNVNLKANLGCLTVLLIFILATAFLSTSSLNPLAVYAADRVVPKIIVSVLGLLLVGGLVQLLMRTLVRWQIGFVANMPPDDVICKGCGFPLLAYISSHGHPILCPRCRTFWHNGPACYSKGLSQKVTVIPNTPCPNCRRDASSFQDLSSDLDELSK